MDLSTQSLSLFMETALEEARASMREGNKGFGAVLIKDGEVVARSHDTAVTASDPTAHAELNLVRAASKSLGSDLTGCAVVSTHEPCPMCTGALIWARVSEIAYGASIAGSMRQGRTMIDLGCKEIVKKAPWEIKVTGGVREQECSTLYDDGVRKLVELFRTTNGQGWEQVSRKLAEKRIAWFEEHEGLIRDQVKGTDPRKAYQLILMKIGIDEAEAPIEEESAERIVFRSMNFCPALEACKILGLDTNEICRRHTERATDALVKKINPRLSFSRNYGNLRPHAGYCEEVITLQR